MFRTTALVLWIAYATGGLSEPRLRFNPLTPTTVMGTAIKHLVPDRVKPSFVNFDVRALCRSALSVRVPGRQNLQMMA